MTKSNDHVFQSKSKYAGFFRFIAPSFLVILASYWPTIVFADDAATAVSLYSHQQYQPALQAFAAIVEKNPQNVSALYYQANCNVGLGKTTAALSGYKHIVDAFPNSAEATSARAVLHRMGVDYGAGSATTSANDKSGKASSKTASGNSRPPGRAITAANKDSIINEIVVPVRALAGRPEVSAATLASIKSALMDYPTPLLSVLHARGCKFYVTPTMIDKEPGLANTKPAGYEDGATYKNCPGMFNGNVTLCEYRFIGDGPDLQTSPDIVGTLRHELGHAVDWYLGRLTAKDDYKHQYLLDLGTIDDGIKYKLDYFCQKDFRGPSETFAELMCEKYGGRPKGNGRGLLVSSSFKLSRAYVDRLIDQVDGSH